MKEISFIYVILILAIGKEILIKKEKLGHGFFNFLPGK